jgi:alkylhydroperoxidase family enzyme
MLEHGAVLRKNGFSAEQIIAILKDYHHAGLSPLEVHTMDYATKISLDSGSITHAEIDFLRQDGLNDQQITDVTLAAVARNFISRFFDALGAGPDRERQEQEPELWEYLKNWRAPIASSTDR